MRFTWRSRITLRSGTTRPRCIPRSSNSASIRDDEGARQYADASRARLETKYTTRIGSLEYVFNLAVPAAKVKWLGLDPQAAFLLSLVDGQTSVAEVLELCQMGRLEALRVFTELLEAKAILRVA